MATLSAVTHTSQQLEDTARHTVNLVKVAQDGCFHERIRPQSEESATIVRGKAKMVVDGLELELKVYSAVKMTAKKTYQFFNEQKETLEILYVSLSQPSLTDKEEELYLRNVEECPKFINEATREMVRELLGVAAGGSKEQSIALVEFVTGAFSPEHLHPVVEESYYFTEGAGKLVIDNKVTEIKAGEFVKIPVGKKHTVSNENSETLKLIAIVVPAWTPDCSVYT